MAVQMVLQVSYYIYKLPHMHACMHSLPTDTVPGIAITGKCVMFNCTGEYI